MVGHPLLNKLLIGELLFSLWIVHPFLAVRVEARKSFDVPVWVSQDVGWDFPFPWGHSSVAVANQVLGIQLWVLIEESSVPIEINLVLLHWVLSLILLLLLFHFIDWLLFLNLINQLMLLMFC